MGASLLLRVGGSARLCAVIVLATQVLAGRLLALDTPAPCRPQLRPHDQLWLVSDRPLGCRAHGNVSELQYWRYDGEKSWVRSDLAALEAADSADLVTTVFVHGNRIGWSEAFTKGWAAYRALVRTADERPLRLIIWSWPSAPIHGLVEDVRMKARRTNLSGYHLAAFVDRLNPKAPLSLWGHSFGARVVTGALHVLGGGQLAGRRLAERVHAARDKVQVVLLVAALDNVWLAPGRFHGRAMSQVDRMLLVNNSCDVALKRYHWIYHRRACQQALGYTGVSPAWLDGDAQAKIEQVDACCVVGRHHTLDGYLWAGGLMARMRNVLLFQSNRQGAGETVAVAEASRE